MQPTQDPCRSCGILTARMQADLAVYVEIVTFDSTIYNDRSQWRVARARLAYQAARNTLCMHVDSHAAIARTTVADQRGSVQQY
jgi:hypothetical protein